MNKDEAQMLLTAFRPGDHEVEDDAMRDALALLRDDPELSAWFAESKALDTAIAGRLASVAVPSSLKADILAGARVSQRQSLWRRSWPWLAVAAMVLAVAVVTLPFVRHAPMEFVSVKAPVATLGEYRSDVGAAFAEMNAGGFKPTLGVKSMADVARYVSSQHSPLGNAEKPGGLASVKPVACRVIDWRGQKVSIICVGREGLEAHVFVVDKQAIRDSGDAGIKAIAKASDYPVAAWEDDKHAYVMVGNTKTTDLSKLLL